VHAYKETAGSAMSQHNQLVGRQRQLVKYI